MVFNEGMTYKEFLSKASDENLEMISKIKKQQDDFFSDIPPETFNDIKNISKTTNIAVFSSVKCPDAATATPILLNLASKNNNIQVKFFEKDEEFLKKNLGEVKVPSILLLDENNSIKFKYCEFPTSLKEKLIKVTYREEADKIISDFRSGKYNKDLTFELINLILGNKQNNYIYFDKTTLPNK